MGKLTAHDEFMRHVAKSLQDGSFVRLVLSSPINTNGAPEKSIGRLVDLKDGPHLSLTLRYTDRDTTKNVPISEVANLLHEQIGVRFRSALLSTTKRDWQLSVR